MGSGISTPTSSKQISTVTSRKSSLAQTATGETKSRGSATKEVTSKEASTAGQEVSEKEVTTAVQEVADKSAGSKSKSSSTTEKSSKEVSVRRDTTEKSAGGSPTETVCPPPSKAKICIPNQSVGLVFRGMTRLENFMNLELISIV